MSVGELLADAQSKTLWLGVAATIDPAEALLIADMLAMEDYVDDSLVQAKAYTDAGVATRAPVVHRHEISDVNGLEAALAGGANSIPIGCILLWSGTIITIPAGFVLCNGLNGTPNLADKFVMGGGGSRTIGSSGGSFSPTGRTSVNGAHAHTGATLGHVLTLAELASHAHGVNDPSHAHSIADPGHVHSYSAPLPGQAGAAVGGFVQTLSQGLNTGLAYTGIGIYGAYTGIGIAAAGGNAAHTHGINSDGGHDHDLTNVSILPPFFVLAFIQRIA
jgi:hypothetical protein